uniref:Aluminum-activated malate transporter n=1 Tax=Kalanchoe fedtschenkoi TaxID=63787 RepID=A0A7N0RFZ8_KALFE
MDASCNSKSTNQQTPSNKPETPRRTMTATRRWPIDSMRSLAKQAKKIARDDPRKVIHSLKVGLALTLISSFYYFQPLYEGFGGSAIWAVMTVVVMFEYTVGETLGKGLNRMLATLVAGMLGLGAHRLATLPGDSGQPIMLSMFVFLIAVTFTFMRFFPKLKARYDYGLSIFILTFSLVTVSAYREAAPLTIAHQRLSTIVIGCSTAVFVCIFVSPVWIGEDFKNLIADNIQKLSNYLEGFGDEYFETTSSTKDGKSTKSDKSFLTDYQAVLTSKSKEESMANFARWEPPHGRFRYRHPWKQYLKVGRLTRECGYKVEALQRFLASEIQTEKELRVRIQEPCMNISMECSNCLKKLSLSIKSMSQPSPMETHISASKTESENLKYMLQSSLWQETKSDLLRVIQAVAMGSLLMDIAKCTEEIAEAVQELATMAGFEPEVIRKNSKQLSAVQPEVAGDDEVHIITMDGTGGHASTCTPKHSDGHV